MKTLSLFIITFLFITTHPLYSQTRLYWANNTTGIMSANLDGSDLDTLLPARQTTPWAIAFDTVENKIYWTDIRRIGIYKSNFDGTNQERILPELNVGLSDIAVDGKNGKIYWVARTETNDQILRANLDGTNPETILTDTLLAFRDIFIDELNEKVYWLNQTAKTMRRANLDGSAVRTIAALSEDPVIYTKVRLDAQRGKMYWDELNFLGNVTIVRANLDGTDPEPVTSFPWSGYRTFDLDGSTDQLFYFINSTFTLISLTEPFMIQSPVSNIAFSDLNYNAKTQELFWAGGDPNGIYKAGLSDITLLPTQRITQEVSFQPEGIAVDITNGKMYWTDPAGNKIQSANLDGGNIEDLVTTGLVTPRGLALDLAGGKMYWTDRGTQGVYRANLNGASRETLLRDVILNPEGLALDLRDQKMYFTVQGRSGINRANLDGTQLEEVILTMGEISDQLAIDLDNNRIYWSQRRIGILRANLDGTEPQVVYRDSSQFIDGGIALDLKAGKIYWIKDTILQRLNLDGTGVENLSTNLSVPASFGGYLTLGATHSYSANDITATKDFSDVAFPKLKIYPTLASSELNVQTQTILNTPIRLRVLDLEGRSVLEKILHGSDVLNVNDLKPGLYLLELQTSDAKRVQKFIKM